jgi:branched-chain amino acid transport system substrate-binding protein
MIHRSMKVAAPLAAVLAMSLAACSSSSGSSSSSTGSQDSPAAPAVLGTPKPAAGTPVRIGYMTDGKTASIDDSSEIPAAQAAVKYINSYLGGIDGHVLSLDVCDDQQTPSGATDCGNQFVTDKVPVVLYNASGQGGMLFKVLAAAHIPLVAYDSVDEPTLLAKTGAYVLTNALTANFAGPAKIAELAGATRAADIVIDVPAASGPAKQLDPIIYKNAGVAVDVIAIPPGTADMTPQIEAELTKNPDQLAVVGDVTFCTSAIKAIKTVAFTKPVVIIQQCITSTSAAGIPGGYAGFKLVATATTDRNDPDVKVYVAAMKLWEPDTPPFVNGVTAGGWATVVGFARAMSGLSGDVTPASVEAAISSMSPEPLPFGAGITFQCNGDQVSILPAMCSTGALEATLDQAGNAVGAFTPLDASALLKL